MSKPQETSIFCDESCHLQNDRIPIMVIGATWCPTNLTREIGVRLREIKQKHGLLSVADLQRPRAAQFEAKWTKVSPGKLDFYLDWIDYFFDDDHLHFRGIVIDKSKLDHESWSQTHDDWYYKMMFRLLEPLIDPELRYRIFLDIKDTRSEQKRKKLEEVLRNANYDYDHSIIERIQNLRSHETEVLQLADLLIGALGYRHRQQRGDLAGPAKHLSSAKLEIIRRIQERSRRSLDRSTWLREAKFNLFCWQAKENE